MDKAKDKDGSKRFWQRVYDKVLDQLVAMGVIAGASLVVAVVPTLRKLMFRPVTVQVWVLVVLAVIPVILLIKHRRKKPKVWEVKKVHDVRKVEPEELIPPKPEEKWKSYTHDRFLGIDWYWSYRDKELVSVRMICPKCKGRVELKRGPHPNDFISMLSCGSCKLSVRAPVSKDLDRWLADQVGQVIRLRNLGPDGLVITSPHSGGYY